MRITATVTIQAGASPRLIPQDVSIEQVVGVEVQLGAAGRDLIIRSAAVGSLGAQYVETKATYDAGTWTRLVLVNE